MILKEKTISPLEIYSYCQLFWPKHMRVTKSVCKKKKNVCTFLFKFVTEFVDGFIE